MELNDQISARNADPYGYPQVSSPWPAATVQTRINQLMAMQPRPAWVGPALIAYYAVLRDLANMATAQQEIDSYTNAVAADRKALKDNNC